MKTRNVLMTVAKAKNMDCGSLQFPDCDIDPKKIKVLMISEVPSQNPADGFYSKAAQSEYMRSTLGLFARAGVEAASMRDILDLAVIKTNQFML